MNVPSTRGRREVADRDADLLRARLRAQSFDHRGREVDAVHANAALRERQRDAAGADPELERGTVARQVREEVDDGIDRLGPEISGPESSYRAATRSPK